MSSARIGLRVGALAAAAGLALAACGGSGTSNQSSSSGSNGGSGNAAKGGTLTFLTASEDFAHLDPQRDYVGEDIAFTNGYLTRTLTAYQLSKDSSEAGQLVGDLATDTGKVSGGGKTWSFTLRDGVKWEDGTDVTCADVKYGISRTFTQSVITDGPTYAIQLLDIPTAADGSSTYKGPFSTDKENNTAAYDMAVQCSADGKTITFHLNRPAGDFNYTVTLPAFAAVPKAKDTGAKYDTSLVSDGPYKVTEYTKGQQLVLDRNPNWSSDVDQYRGAYPDKIVMKFGIDSTVIDQRMQADAGADQTAISRDALDTSSLTTVFNDPRFASRRVNEYDPYVYYLAINTQRVPNLKHRQAIMAAMDRGQILTVDGGSYAGDIADGVIKPNLKADYAPTGLWDTLLGEKVLPSGNPDLAKKLIAESGRPMPTITYDYGQDPVRDKEAAAIQSALARAGITVKLNGVPRDQRNAIELNPETEGSLEWTAWGPDWLNASTVIPELFASSGGWPLSRVDNKSFNKAAAAAKAELDRDKQAAMWQKLDKQAMANAWAVPIRFSRTQRLAGSKVGAASGDSGRVYLWAPYGSWSYPDLYVKK